jgi:hypothetical protein
MTKIKNSMTKGETVFWLKSLYQLGFVRFLISIFGLGS